MWRQEWLRRCEKNPAAQRDLIDACSASLILTINLLYWSQLKNAIDEEGREIDPPDQNYPAITFPCQDEALTVMQDCLVKREPLVVWKTREMGVSWMAVWLFDWHLQFGRQKDFLVLSRAEELVDSSDDPDSLFAKFLYLLNPERMPAWIGNASRGGSGGEGKIKYRLKNLKNPVNDCAITGRATSSHAGAGGRRNAAILDEFSRVDNAAKVWETLSDTCKARFAISTPLQGSEFNRMYMSGKYRTVFLPWWLHPWKGRNMRWVRKAPSATAMCVNGWYATSPWYERQVASRDASDLAENVDCNPKGSRESFFTDQTILDRHEAMWCVPPKHTGEITYDLEIDVAQVDENLRQRVWETVGFVDSNAKDAGWKFWCDLVPIDPNDPLSPIRPPQDRAYVAGADLSMGSGASNTVFSFYDVETHEQVAEYACPHIAPHNAARLFVAAATWFGGVVPVFHGWEANGPGVPYGSEMMQLDWPHVYYQEQVGSSDTTPSRRYGWTSNTGSKMLLVSTFRKAVERGTMVVRSRDTLRECGEYIRYDDGGIGPAGLAADSSGARAAHGDRVIANAICAMLLEKYSHFDVQKRVTHDPSSFAYRHAQRKREKARRARDDWS